ncbi:MAG: DUF4439 domain-containing protein [Propionibacteriaceae bacterium]|nr:DUF4439 domain-containing protein [Propionibacteriaceae bacterium]
MTSLPRRGFLAFAGVLTLGVTGCQVSDPVIRGGAGAPPPEPSPTPEPTVPGQEVALRHEVELAALAGQVAAAADRLRLSPAQTATAGWLATAHDAHATALLDPYPARRATAAPSPAPGRTPRHRPVPAVTLTAGPREEAARSLHDRLEGALADYRRAALGLRGPTALVWGSLAAYARAAQVALTRDAPRPEPPVVEVRELEPWSDAQAEQQMLRQAHALVYGYQVAIPWLARPEARVAHDILAARRDLRDRLADRLRDRGQAAPAADPAYALPVQPTDPRTASGLLSRMETAFAPFTGAWLAAATDESARRWALENLESTVGHGIEWGGPLSVWPGWPA